MHFPHAVYHVTLRGNNRQGIFEDVADREALSELLADGVSRFGHLIHAFAFMTNHLHLAVEVARLPLATIVHNFASRYARYFNRRHARCGHLFQRRHHAGLIDSEQQLRRLVRYIHLNPVRAGLAAAAGAYPWSSHAAYLGRRVAPAWLSTAPVLSLFAATTPAARSRLAAFVAEGLAAEDSPRVIEQAERTKEDRLLVDAWVRQPIFEIPRRDLRIEELLDAVCGLAAVRREDLISPSQRRTCSRARGIAAWLVRRSPNLTLSALGSCVGRDLSSLSRAADAVEHSAATDQALRELLRRAAHELRVG